MAYVCDPTALVFILDGRKENSHKRMIPLDEYVLNEILIYLSDFRDLLNLSSCSKDLLLSVGNSVIWKLIHVKLCQCANCSGCGRYKLPEGEVRWALVNIRIRNLTLHIQPEQLICLLSISTLESLSYFHIRFDGPRINSLKNRLLIGSNLGRLNVQQLIIYNWPENWGSSEFFSWIAGDSLRELKLVESVPPDLITSLSENCPHLKHLSIEEYSNCSSCLKAPIDFKLSNLFCHLLSLSLCLLDSAPILAILNQPSFHSQNHFSLIELTVSIKNCENINRLVIAISKTFHNLEIFKFQTSHRSIEPNIILERSMVKLSQNCQNIKYLEITGPSIFLAPNAVFCIRCLQHLEKLTINYDEGMSAALGIVLEQADSLLEVDLFYQSVSCTLFGSLDSWNQAQDSIAFLAQSNPAVDVSITLLK